MSPSGIVNIFRIGVAFCLILFLNLLFSCKRENAYVHGQAQNMETQKPIKGLEVHLIQGYRDSNYAAQRKVIQTTYTDADGQYMLRYRHSLGTQYWVRAGDNLTDYTAFFYEELADRKRALTIPVYYTFYVRTRIKKTGYTDDHVYISGYNNKGFVRGEPIKMNFNKPYDTTLTEIYESIPAKERHIVWYLVTDPYSGATIQHLVKLNASPGDTIDYVIEFE
ncbi:MAG: hypothetical protein JNK73_07175 [Bacteroidia bacterium]|nr:hypothetical protein [Bacteroidia bacterium]